MRMHGQAALPSSYDPWLVVLSVLIASLAAYTALIMAERVTVAQGRGRMVWLLGGATTMGCGIWSMHFTGMLAFQLPRPVSYDAPTVALSLVAAIVASGIALVVVSRRALTWRSWLLGGVLMGGAIGAMHYTGMAAIRMAADAHYAAPIVALSIGIAVVVALIALWLAFHLRGGAGRSVRHRRVASAGVMGVAVAGMHYTGMAAASFTPGMAPHGDGLVVASSALGAAAITLVTLLILGLALAVALVDRSLSAQGERYRALSIHASDLVLIVRADGTIAYASPSSRHVLGYSTAEMEGLSVQSFAHPDDRSRMARSVAELRTQPGLSAPHLYRVRHADGSWRTIESLPNVCLDDPVIAGIVVNLRDVTERVAAEDALNALRRQHELLLNSAGEGIFGLDQEQRITFANPAAAAILGYTVDELLHQPIDTLIPDDGSAPVGSHPIHTALRDGAARHAADELFRHKDGTAIPVEYRATPVYDGERVLGAVVTFQDITERVRSEMALQHQATHDALTDLPNRALLDRELGAVLTGGAAGGEAALLLLDLDRFKEVNDTLGHRAGDLLLCQVAERLRNAIRKTDLVARLGGDEFAVLLPGADAVTALRVAENLGAVLDATCLIEGQAIRTGGSIGIAIAPLHSGDADTLLRYADTAMYAAKRGRRTYALYDPAQDAHSPERLALLGELREAIAGGALQLHYQPKATLSTGQVAAVEALARWPHPERGFIPPGQFIPLAEASGLIGPLTLWVLGEAVRQCGAWRQEGQALEIAVNLSAWTLHDPEILTVVDGLLQAHDVPPALLRLEVTESAVMDDPDRALDVLARLSALGVRLSIDDFGTGYSSLSYLKRLPVDELKIDQAFVRQVAGDETDATIVRSTVSLGHNLGLNVVAEGVEDEAAWRLLADAGCDRAQGYYLARPMPASDVARWLRAREAGGDDGAAPERIVA